MSRMGRCVCGSTQPHFPMGGSHHPSPGGSLLACDVLGCLILGSDFLPLLVSPRSSFLGQVSVYPWGCSHIPAFGPLLPMAGSTSQSGARFRGQWASPRVPSTGWGRLAQWDLLLPQIGSSRELARRPRFQESCHGGTLCGPLLFPPRHELLLGPWSRPLGLKARAVTTERGSLEGGMTIPLTICVRERDVAELHSHLGL